MRLFVHGLGIQGPGFPFYVPGWGGGVPAVVPPYSLLVLHDVSDEVSFLSSCLCEGGFIFLRLSSAA